MSPELRAVIEEHAGKIRRLIHDHQVLIRELSTRHPTLIEREALASVLHSFYSGIEFIMRAVARDRGNAVWRSADWHRTLLDSMVGTFSDTTVERLQAYRGFRHRFRNIYGFELSWESMLPLVTAMESVWKEVERELNPLTHG